MGAIGRRPGGLAAAALFGEHHPRAGMYKSASRFWQGHVFRNEDRRQTRRGSEALPTADQPVVPRALVQAHAVKRTVEGTLGALTRGGWTVWINGFACFCPASHLCLDADVPLKNARLPFLVIEVAERRAVVSHRAWRDRERARELADLRDACSSGVRVTGTVTRVESYGAFIRFRHIAGLVHVSELSESFVGHPTEIVVVGDRVEVVVLAVESDRRISLRFLRLLPRERAAKQAQKPRWSPACLRRSNIKGAVRSNSQRRR